MQLRRFLPRGRALAACVAAVALAAPAAASALLGVGAATRQLPLSGGAAWLASPAQGLLTLVDGPSERVVGSVRLAGASTELTVWQDDTSALVADAGQGTVSRVDGATWDREAPVRLAEPGDGLVLHGGAGRSGGVVAVVPSTGVAHAMDPADLARPTTVGLAARPGAGQSLVDDAGVLWVVDGERGGLTRVDLTVPEPGKQLSPDLVDRHARLALVAGEPVVVDLSQSRLGPLTRDGRVTGWSCLDLPADDAVQLVGSETADELYAVLPGTGTLLTSALTGDDCTRVVSVARPGDELGPAVQSQGFLFVPNRTTGRTVVVDLDAGTVAGDVELAEPGASLELVVSGGIVFYHDRDSELAGVLRLDGGGRWVAGEPLRKYGDGVADLGTVADGEGLGDATTSGDDQPGAAGAGEDPASDPGPGGADPGTPAGDEAGAPAVGAVPPGPGGGDGGGSPVGRPGDPAAGALPGGTPPDGDGPPPGQAPPPRSPSPPAPSPPMPSRPAPSPPPAAPPTIEALAAAPDPATPGEPLIVTAETTGTGAASWEWQAVDGTGGVLGSGTTADSFTVDVPARVTGPVTVALTVDTAAGSAQLATDVAVARPAAVTVECAPDLPGLGQPVSCTGTADGGTVAAGAWQWTVTGPAGTTSVSQPAGDPLDVGAFDATGDYVVDLTVGEGGLSASAADSGTVTDTCRFEDPSGPDIVFSNDPGVGQRRSYDAPFTGCFREADRAVTQSTAGFLVASTSRVDVTSPAAGAGVARLAVDIDGYGYPDGRSAAGVTARLPNGGAMAFDVLTNRSPEVTRVNACYVWTSEVGGDDNAHFIAQFDDGDPSGVTGVVTLQPGGQQFATGSPYTHGGGSVWRIAAVVPPAQIPPGTTGWSIVVTDGDGAQGQGTGGRMGGSSIPGFEDCAP